MYFLPNIKELLGDFLFPKSRRVLELETLSIETLLQTLPPAQNPKDSRVTALFDYSHPLVKEIVWELKYGGNRRLADKLGAILYDVIRHELDDLALFEKWKRPILLPIPISDKRRFERGWNQSELLANAIKSHDREKFFKYRPGQLAKVRHTESQTKTASRSERLKNLAASMKVLNPATLTGECVVVLDDVTTTGSTFAEARRALSLAKVKRIMCVAVAH